MTDERKTVGQVEIIGLSDGSAESQAGAVFPDVPESAWAQFGGPEAQGQVTLNFGCYLVRTPGLAVLVDTGIGGALLEGLAAHGIRLEDVQAVAYTHLHGDHIGWNLTGSDQDRRPTFPNARYYVPRGDWLHFVDRNSPGFDPSVQDKFQALKDRGLVQLVDNGDAICPELKAWATPGHTPGHSCFTVESQGQWAVIVGDAIIHPIQVGHPEWNSSYDADGDTAARSREELVAWMAERGSLGGVSHFRAPGFGRVVREGGTPTWRAE